ncbi:hypothetical protein TNCT_708561 [Trichonephila clavata]|uniref:Uncharacterized protein n=1 Tax=Trichonephila clavata TaxID=2740835 RepID=A0A8X6L6M8_TRICU|nr:hypothetical protein TNCT_708561 [Trichonephila clavata]
MLMMDVVLFRVATCTSDAAAQGGARRPFVIAEDALAAKRVCWLPGEMASTREDLLQIIDQRNLVACDTFSFVLSFHVVGEKVSQEKVAKALNKTVFLKRTP